MPSKKCKLCYFRKKLAGETFACHYMLETGEPRGCDPKDCDKFRPRRSAATKATLGGLTTAAKRKKEPQ